MENNTQNLPAAYAAPAPAPSVFTDMTAFEAAQRVCKMLASSNLVPQQFQGNIANTMIALEMAQRMGGSPFMVMQNLYVVHGRPAFSATYIIAAINACGRFSPLRFDLKGEGDDMECVAWVVEKATGERLDGSPVNIRMAKEEGWYNRNGSKWKTMPQQMLRYRAATFFGRLYAPDILMGMRTDDELYDIGEAPAPAPRRVNGATTDATPATGAAAINALLEEEPAAEPAPEAKEPEQEAQQPGHEGDGEGSPQWHSMMGYIDEINAIDDPEKLRSWWQGQDYKKILDELGGMSSEYHRTVAERVQDRIKELEANGEAEKTDQGKGNGKLPPALTKYLERKQ